MRPSRTRRRACLLPLVLLLALWLPQAAEATLMRPLTIEEMARRADAVVRAQTLDVRVEWGEESRLPITFVRLEILEILHGDLPVPARIEIAQAGGTREGVTLDYGGRPRFAPGEENVLFLLRRGTRYTVLGLAQGKFEVGAADPFGRRRLSRNLDGIEILTPEGAPARRPPADLEVLRGVLRAQPRVLAGPPQRSTP